MKDVYAAVTERILSVLAQGVVLWHTLWDARQGRPRNLVSGKPYRGMNVWMLAGQGGSPFWLTYRQARQIGGHVKQGERGTLVMFWKWLAKKAQPDAAGETAEETQPRGYAMARAYTVFNATQCELPEAWRERAEITTPELAGAEKIQACEQIVDGMPQRPAIVHAGVRAFYRPSADRVTMPEPARFEAPARYYSTLFHELTHATGHPRRLHRETLADMVAFGDTNYSKEELCVEMGAAFLCGVAGIENETVTASAAYIRGWLRQLQDDTKLLIQAAAQAQRAADFILGETPEATEA